MLKMMQIYQECILLGFHCFFLFCFCFFQIFIKTLGQNDANLLIFLFDCRSGILISTRGILQLLLNFKRSTKLTMVILMYAHKTKLLILNTVYCFQDKNRGNLAYHSG